MAYTPNNWECGDTVTADKLNNLEEGVQEALECCGGGADFLIANMTSSASGCLTFDKTWQEIHDAFLQGKPCFLMANQASGHILQTLLVLRVSEEIHEVDGVDVTVYTITTSDANYSYGEMSAPNDYVYICQEV